MVNEGHIRQILAVLRAEYGNKVLIDEPRIKLWMLVLGHATFDEIQRAVAVSLSKGGQFPPSVGELNQIVLEAREGVKSDWGTLWDRVLAAAQRSSYYSEEEGAKLPPEALRAIGGTTGLRELACSNPENIGVIRAQFRQRLEARKTVDQFEATNAHITALLDKQPIKRIQ